MVDNTKKGIEGLIEEQEQEEDTDGIMPSVKAIVGKNVEIITSRRSWRGRVVKYDDKYKIIVIKTSQGVYTVRLRNIISFGILR
jgi:hypothetical protein